ncbi:MAG: exostosin family protein [Parcubacteria group bacterium]|nr:exostosin family protein [Parcubacteria group bacterium]
MAKVYIGELFPGGKPLRFLNRELKIPPYEGKKPYRAIFDEMDFSFITVVSKPEGADFILIPYTYPTLRNNKTYISHFVELAQRHNKKILAFALVDSDEQFYLPHTLFFRYAGYRYRGAAENEIITPTQIYASDILANDLFYLRNKKEIPVVSFCGWAELNSLRQRLKYLSKTIPLDVKKYIFRSRYAEVHKQGIYWRKRAIAALQNSRLIKTSFLIRNFYSANKNTVQGDPMVLRKEYIGNIRNSDFVLIVRGDANMAVRFYETLALGRIPVLIDTEWMLPSEGEIDYKKFVVFVPYTDIKNTDKYIRKFWDGMSDEEFKKKQTLARDTFMKYLKFDSFLKYVFENKLK